jgi:hypothetical protein
VCRHTDPERGNPWLTGVGLVVIGSVALGGLPVSALSNLTVTGTPTGRLGQGARDKLDR